jgi:nicotinate phosphoribosyltransferase
MGTSNVEAGFCFGIPTFGTLAHSFVMAYGDEEKSFRDFQRVFPEHAVILVDTYDTLVAIDKIIHMGLRPRGVRLDSGDLVELSKEVRRRLDRAGLRETRIFASGDLDETAITEALAAGAVIDFFGVGTELATSKDAPTLSSVYKLVEVEQDGQVHYVAKFSEDKVTYPGRKQVFRFADNTRCYDYDLIARAGEQHEPAEPLLECAMRNGRRTNPSPPLNDVQERARRALQQLPRRYRQLRNAPPYPVRISDTLRDLLEKVRTQVMGTVVKESGR